MVVVFGSVIGGIVGVGVGVGAGVVSICRISVSVFVLLAPTWGTVSGMTVAGTGGACGPLGECLGLFSSVSNCWVNRSITSNSSRLAGGATNSCPVGAGVRSGTGGWVGFVFCPELLKDDCVLSSS